MINKQRGAITLLVSSVILVVTLIFSLGSYKSIFYQIKRAQNEIEARKGHWAAEGELSVLLQRPRRQELYLASLF